jgi:hypothetical protein
VTARRFPPPWTIDEMNDACFIVRDKNGQALGSGVLRSSGYDSSSVLTFFPFRAI